MLSPSPRKWGEGCREGLPVIGAKAFCILRWQDRFLLSEGYDPVKDEHFLRPLGGSIEFGEFSESAVVRELKEEIGADLENVLLLGVLESRFVFDGKPGHEIVFVYEAGLVDQQRYSEDSFFGVESDGKPFPVRWISREELQGGQRPLYPHGLLAML